MSLLTGSSPDSCLICVLNFKHLQLTVANNSSLKMENPRIIRSRLSEDENVNWDLKFPDSELDCFVGEHQTEPNMNCRGADASNSVHSVLPRDNDPEPTILSTWHLTEEPEYSQEFINSCEFVFPETDTCQSNVCNSGASDFMMLDWADEHYAAERLCKSLDMDSTTGVQSASALGRQQLSASSMNTSSGELTSFPPIALRGGVSAGELGNDTSSDITAEAVKTKILSVWTNVRNGKLEFYFNVR